MPTPSGTPPRNARSRAARRAAAVTGLVAASLLGTGCGGPEPPKPEIYARVVARDGATPTDMDVQIAAGLLDLELGRMGFDRRSVTPTADRRVRIVLPDGQAARVPEVIQRLGDPRFGVEVEPAAR